MSANNKEKKNNNNKTKYDLKTSVIVVLIEINLKQTI
jgi:hypothetical protein